MKKEETLLTEEQVATLNALAEEQNVSLNDLIRQSIDYYIYALPKLSPPQIPWEERVRRGFSVIGIAATEETDLSINHDKYLAEIYGQS